ncbi:MAG: hypothetical protein K2N31_02295 [Treponemataceae bacterium]|nr:hypothetical protein [Treponemataceae bacterium]
MKKIISFAVTVCAVATLFAVSRPSLDGRAVVADTGVMPKGMFARTIGYLPGDSVAVTNPATGSTVDVLVLGAVDPGDGVAILLSPEAADRLQIRKNANVQVKITKRTGNPDEAVFGTAVLAEGDDFASADDNPPAPVAELPLPAERETAAVLVPEESARTVSEDPVVAEYVLPPVFADDSRDDDVAFIPDVLETAEPPASADAEIVPAAYDDPVLAEAAAQPVVIEYSPYPTDALADINIIVKEVTDGTPRAADEPERYDDDVDAYLDDLAESLLGERVFAEELPDSDDVVATEFPPDALDEIDVADFDPDTDDDIAADEVEYIFDDLADADDDIAADDVEYVFDDLTDEDDDVAADEEEYVFDDFADEDEEIAYEFVWYDDYDSASESPIEEEYLRDDVAPAFEDVARSEKFTADIDRDHTDSEAADEAKPQADSDAYQSIVLVPAPENPPEDGENPADDPASVVPIVVVPEQSPSGMEAYIVPSLKDLQDGAYYVQISTLSDRENIEAVLDTYAETYPMAIVPLASGAAYQILVGPLSVDEYGTVLEKFKAFGFRDAFLRKIRGSRTLDPK